MLSSACPKMQKRHVAVIVMFAVCLFNILWSYFNLMEKAKIKQKITDSRLNQAKISSQFSRKIVKEINSSSILSKSDVSSSPRTISQEQAPSDYSNKTQEIKNRSLCSARAELCDYSKDIKRHLSLRHRFAAFTHRPIPKIYIDTSVKKLFGEAPWLHAPAIAECNSSCNLITESKGADVVVSLFKPPGERRGDIAYAVLSMEPHSLELPANATNIALISFNRESEVVVTYGYSVMHSLGLCVGNAEGVRPDGRRCENMRARDSSFYRWCAAGYGGDLFTCVFQVVPHVLRSAPSGNKTAGALGVTWVGAPCERHGNYLEELMRHMRIDSMGGCYSNRNEGEHPALSAKVRVLLCLIYQHPDCRPT